MLQDNIMLMIMHNYVLNLLFIYSYLIWNSISIDLTGFSQRFTWVSSSHYSSGRLSYLIYLITCRNCWKHSAHTKISLAYCFFPWLNSWDVIHTVIFCKSPTTHPLLARAINPSAHRSPEFWALSESAPWYFINIILFNFKRKQIHSRFRDRIEMSALWMPS